MNKVVLLNDLKREKKKTNILLEKNKCELNKIEIIDKSYDNFKQKFCDYIECNEQDNINPELSKINEIILKLFLIDNKKPFIDLINSLYDDCLGTNTSLRLVSDEDSKRMYKSLIIFAEDDYRKFRYDISVQSYDMSNIGLTIKKDNVNDNFNNVVNFQVKKNQYKKACNIDDDKQNIKQECEFKLIVIDSNTDIPDLFEITIKGNKEVQKYKLDILKSWKYDFKKLTENNMYLLAPLKVFDFKKRLDVLLKEEYSEKIIKDEVVRFFKDMNSSFYRIKNKGIIDEQDINQLNLITMELLNVFMIDGYIFCN